MRIQLTWADSRTLALALPGLDTESLRPVLRWALTHAEPVLAGAAEAAGAGVLARLLVPMALCLVRQQLEGPETG
ncbi:hypothetical protein [Streptomyces orinoci]|uniref:Uncharacterized protein n=1 Tax=Streptomyces orinoci TaxID=67339 RepID=A0ABV3K3B3_STRON|nr:hypothetical protein [Streptomyces orinoci]